MPPLESVEVAASLERCIDELGEKLAGLGEHSNATLAFGLRTHLAALLQVMLERGECTRDEVLGFLDDLEEEALAAA